MKIGYLGISGVFTCLTLVGCDEAPDIQPLAPPGAYIAKTSPDAEPAQAQGETLPTSNKTTAETPKVVSTTKTAPPTATGETKTTERGVKYQTLKEGTGPELKPGQKAEIQYEGKLENGTVFDSGRIPVAIGTGAVIKGWDEAIPGMKVGEKRKLTIPPAMAYGAQGSGGKIPPNSTLIFDVELIGIKQADVVATSIGRSFHSGTNRLAV